MKLQTYKEMGSTKMKEAEDRMRSASMCLIRVPEEERQGAAIFESTEWHTEQHS